MIRWRVHKCHSCFHCYMGSCIRCSRTPGAVMPVVAVCDNYDTLETRSDGCFSNRKPEVHIWKGSKK